MSHNTQSTNQAGVQPTTMERIAAHIPGTTEHAERHHPNLARHGHGHGHGGTGNVMASTGAQTRGAYDTQAAGGLPPTASQAPYGASNIPGTQQQQQQQYGANTGNTTAAVPTAAAGQPGFHQGFSNTADPAFPPSTGQKVAGKTKAGMGRLVGNERMEAEGIQKASGGAYSQAPPAGNTQPGAYPPPPPGF